MAAHNREGMNHFRNKNLKIIHNFFFFTASFYFETAYLILIVTKLTYSLASLHMLSWLPFASLKGACVQHRM